MVRIAFGSVRVSNCQFVNALWVLCGLIFSEKSIAFITFEHTYFFDQHFLFVFFFDKSPNAKCQLQIGHLAAFKPLHDHASMVLSSIYKKKHEQNDRLCINQWMNGWSDALAKYIQQFACDWQAQLKHFSTLKCLGLKNRRYLTAGNKV